MTKTQLLAQMATACEQGNTEKMVHLATRRGVDVNHVNMAGYTWLMIACARKNYRTIETLLALGADPRKRGEVNIHDAVSTEVWNVPMDAYYFANVRAEKLLDRAAEIRKAWLERQQLGQMVAAKKLPRTSRTIL